MLIVPQDLILIKILLKKILTGLINSAQNYHPKIHRLKTYKTHFLNSYLVNHKRSSKTLDVYLSFFFFFWLPRNFVCSQTFSKNQKEKFLGGARIQCTRHIYWVTHTLVGPTVCEGCLCVRDPTSIPGITYNFCLG